jgi:hypothetical protein
VKRGTGERKSGKVETKREEERKPRLARGKKAEKESVGRRADRGSSALRLAYITSILV